MADESEGGTERPIESTEEKLEKVASERDNAVGAVKKTEETITANKAEMDRLQGEIRSDEVKLPELKQNQQNAQKNVDDLLSLLEKEVGLGIKRIDPSGPVVQGGTAKYKATLLHPLPKQTRLSWDTGGCPFTKEGETITVETSAVGPGDYAISVNLEWVSSQDDDPDRTVTIKTTNALSAK